MGKTRYSRKPASLNNGKDFSFKICSNLLIAVKASGKDLRVSFKNTFETANAVKNMELLKAMDYLRQVVAHERAIPFRRFNGSMGRCT